MTAREIRPLAPQTWDAFAALVEKHNGIFGGCWCCSFHGDTPTTVKAGHDGRTLKRLFVEEGAAHAALVFEGDAAIGWAQYGSPAELPNIYHRKEYAANVVDPARYRITCFFVDRDHRRSGVARDALAGVLQLVAAAGGGSVEGYPQNDPEKKISASFLYSGTRSMFEAEGFEYVRPLGTKRQLMRREVEALSR
ncbi:GNAT family N-acetyltransferase [Gryllotalpicola ginsengisoli]|uniref:GNAT family N-acetyltransferase n=1 Tax=Gryllotalpicola ginsengisoli TaxID=444608 RepID=UPI0003B72FC6|nr:GNAT family N-acetyltransferase [Gryllotalpicola ginsengisoli]